MQTSNAPGWDSQRGSDIWSQRTPAERPAQLAQVDRLLWAALNIQVTTSGQARVARRWREVNAAPLR